MYQDISSHNIIWTIDPIILSNFVSCNQFFIKSDNHKKTKKNTVWINLFVKHKKIVQTSLM
jgi:hypothetical protein